MRVHDVLRWTIELRPVKTQIPCNPTSSSARREKRSVLRWPRCSTHLSVQQQRSLRRIVQPSCVRGTWIFSQPTFVRSSVCTSKAQLQPLTLLSPFSRNPQGGGVTQHTVALQTRTRTLQEEFSVQLEFAS